MVKHKDLRAEQLTEILSDKEQQLLRLMESTTDAYLIERFPTSTGWVYVPEKDIHGLIEQLNHWRRGVLIKAWKKIYENDEAGWKIQEDSDERSTTPCYEFRQRS